MPIKVKLEINENGTIGVREREIVVLPGGREIDAGFHRTVIDVDDNPVTKLKHGDAAVLAKVQAAVSAFHTPAVVAARRAVLAAAEARGRLPA